MFSRISNIFIVSIMLIGFGGVLQATAAEPVKEGKTWEAIRVYKEGKGSSVRLNLAKLLYDSGRKAKASKFRAEAAKLSKEGNHEESAKLYIESAKLYEEIVENKDTRIVIARRLYDERKYDESAKSYREIVDSYYNIVAEKAQGIERISEADSLYGEGKYENAAQKYADEAKQQLSEAAGIYEEIAADNTKRLENAGKLYTEGNYNEAVKLYKDFVDSHKDIDEKDNPDANLNQAQSLYNENKHDEASKLYKEIAEKKASKVQYLAGVCYYHSGEPKKAIEVVFDKVIGNLSNPYRLDAYYGKCLAIRDLPEQDSPNKWTDIENVANAAHEAFPNPNEEEKKILENIDLLKAYAGQKKSLGGGIPERIRKQEEIINNPGSPQEEKTRAQQKIGDLYSGGKTGDTTHENTIGDVTLKNAIQAYRNLSEPMAMYQIAAYYYNRQSYSDCVEAVNKVFEKYPADTLESQISARLYFMRGDSKYNQKSDIAGAISDLEKAIERANQIPKEQISNSQSMSQQLLSKFDAYYQIGALCLKLRDIRQKEIGDNKIDGEKLGYIQKAIDAFGNLLKDYEAHYKALIDAGKKEEAQNLMDKVVDAGVTKANLIADSGDLDGAIEELEKLQNSIESSSKYLSEDRKIQMQYTRGYLFYQRMIKSLEAGSGADLDGRLAINIFSLIRSQYLPDDIKNTPIKNPPEKVVPFLRDSLFMLGMTYYQLKDGRNALDSFQDLVDCADKGVLGDINQDAKLQDFLQRALFQMAIIYNEAGISAASDRGDDEAIRRYDEAIRILESLISRFPTNSQDKPLWQYEIGNVKLAQAQTPPETINKYNQAKDAYNEVLNINPQHNIANDALWSIIVCWDSIERLTADSTQKAQIEENNIKPLCERFDNEYRNSDYAPKAYNWLGAYYFNRGNLETALGYFQKAYNHPKAINPKIGNAKIEAQQNIQTTVIPMIENNILNAQNLIDQRRDIDGLKQYKKAASLCLTLITYFPNDNTVRTRVNGYIVDGFTMSVTLGNQIQQRRMTAIESVVGNIETSYNNNPPTEIRELIQEIRNTIQQIREIQSPRGARPGTPGGTTPVTVDTTQIPESTTPVPPGTTPVTVDTTQISEGATSISNHPLIYRAYELLVELYVIWGDGFANSGDYIHAKENYNFAINNYNRIIRYIETYGK